MLVRDANVQLAPDAIVLTHFVDYRQRTPETAIALLVALSQAPTAGPLPDPLPAPPPPPVADLGPIRERVGAPTLTFAEQQSLLEELRARVDNADERDAVVALLHQLRTRSDVVEAIGREADAIVAAPARDDQGRRAWSQPAERPVGAALLSAEDVDLLRSLVTHIRSGHFTPILGLGLTDSLIGTRQLLARQWARTFEFPMARHQQEDLPQRRPVRDGDERRGDAAARASAEYLREQLAERYPEVVAAHADASLGELWKLAWEQQLVALPRRSPRRPGPAALPDLRDDPPGQPPGRGAALRGQGAGRRALPLAARRLRLADLDLRRAEPDYVPTPERPLVFHVFGNLDVPGLAASSPRTTTSTSSSG